MQHVSCLTMQSKQVLMPVLGNKISFCPLTSMLTADSVNCGCPTSHPAVPPPAVCILFCFQKLLSISQQSKWIAGLLENSEICMCLKVA